MRSRPWGKTPPTAELKPIDHPPPLTIGDSPMQAPLVKLCGLRTAADIAAANAAQPDFAGFVIDVAGKRRSIPLAHAIELASSLDPAIRPVGVFMDAPVETVNRFLTEAPNAAVQLHGSENAAHIANLRSIAGLQAGQASDPAQARIIQALRNSGRSATHCKQPQAPPTWCCSTAGKAAGVRSIGACSRDSLDHSCEQAALARTT